MKSTKQKRRNRNHRFKAITLALFLHIALIGGLLYVNGDLDHFFQNDVEQVENTDEEILAKALANTRN